MNVVGLSELHGGDISRVYEVKFARQALSLTFLYSVGKSQAKRDGFLTGYGPIERRDWEETLSLYRLYHALEWWDWVGLVGGDRPSGLIEEMELITAK